MKQLKNQSPIIIGAGIAGLSSALALAHKGIASIIIEKRKQLDNIGSGIQLTPNATRILARWGVLNKLIKLGIKPHFLELKDGVSLKTHLHVDLIHLSEKRWKFPYITIHRADLQKVLYNAVIKNPLIKYKMGENIISFTQSATDNIEIKTITIEEKTRTQQYQFYSTSLLIGCDGVWSTLRQFSPFHEKASFSNFIAWRATREFENLPPNFRSLLQNIKTITAWMGPKNHLIAYPIQSAKKFNFVAITHGKNPGKKWKQIGNKETLKSLFNDWNPEILQVLNHIDEWSYWPLFQMKYNRFLGLQQQVFVGDCAHAFLPFAAQGVAMAIEDAATLAEVLSLSDLSLIEATKLYEKIRRPRVTAVKKRGDFNRFVYHATGPIAIARNFFMKIHTAENIMSRLDWLYTYDAMNLTKNDIRKHVIDSL
ncbi:salicylate hydroxylase [Bartonella clarridgeiae 73]|uniref:Salicylate hydroxylase n=1 Tax=Bartonella clarridgeiae (strain CCUG 45776 / CIP 104772 / 73) TaxID=696125 RepID=E6YHM3_BARC7|nr:FAD-binding protein [Bartonella clarridgeiae]WCR55063.1 MAG: putative oxidoreductase [Bartonella clarridgeiae]CBI76361.1 salicylate hydroxylase [Bartonella clarridgeiae 73]